MRFAGHLAARGRIAHLSGQVIRVGHAGQGGCARINLPEPRKLIATCKRWRDGPPQCRRISGGCAAHRCDKALVRLGEQFLGYLWAYRASFAARALDCRWTVSKSETIRWNHLVPPPGFAAFQTARRRHIVAVPPFLLCEKLKQR